MKSAIKLPVLALLALLSFASCSTNSIEDEAEALELKLVSQQAKVIELEILNLINDHRLSKGLSPLEDMSIVKSVAFSHTDYMVDNDEVSHHNFYTRSNYLKANAGAQQVSENVAYGYSSAESVVDAWIKSEAHKDNIEGDQYLYKKITEY